MPDASWAFRLGSLATATSRKQHLLAPDPIVMPSEQNAAQYRGRRRDGENPRL